MMDSNRAYLVQLKQLISRYYSLDEIRNLAFDLAIKYDNLPGDTREMVIIELLEHVERNQKLLALHETLKRQRPEVIWPEPPVPTVTTFIEGSVDVEKRDTVSGTIISGRDVVIQQITESLDPQMLSRITHLLGKATEDYLKSQYQFEDFPIDQNILVELKAIGEPAITALRSALVFEDESGLVAAQILGALGENSLPVLIEAANDKVPTVRQKAIIGLGRIGKSGQVAIEHALQDEDEKVCATALMVLGNFGKSYLMQIVPFLENSSDVIRKGAVEACGRIGEDALSNISHLVHDPSQEVRKSMVIALGEMGADALPYLDQALQDENQIIRYSALSRIGAMVPESFDILEKAAKNPDFEIRIGTLTYLSKIGEPALDTIFHALNDDKFKVRAKALNELDRFPAEVLCKNDKSLDLFLPFLSYEDVTVRQLAIKQIAKYGLAALNILNQAAKDEDASINRIAIEALGQVGKTGLEELVNLLNEEEVNHASIAHILGENIDDVSITQLEEIMKTGNEKARFFAISILIQYVGEPAASTIICALEDESGKISGTVLEYLADTHHINPVPPRVCWKLILEEIIRRITERPSLFFNARITSQALEGLIKRSPRIHQEIMVTLADLVFEEDMIVRQRITDITRQFDSSEFANLIKSRASNDPTTAADIIRMLGGGEAAAYFSELQSQSLERFREPLINLEKTGRERWDELTQEARESSDISRKMSVYVFAVGTFVVLSAIVLLALSGDLVKQIVAGGSAVISFLLMYNRQFWKEPVEQIQKFSAQQARLQASFIGYMNRVAQIRLVFENDYTKGTVGLDSLEKYQRLLSEATEQAWSQLETVQKTDINES